MRSLGGSPCRSRRARPRPRVSALVSLAVCVAVARIALSAPRTPGLPQPAAA
ncbi:hypothetical protein [Microtetraspora fusca]|uniref:hypothetical protein n=1 Tax=Microtetraspora fusca TaxID=1997 RepID=UPI0012F87D82|nr:hypothetical protein [Microtetraspora fusca]